MPKRHQPTTTNDSKPIKRPKYIWEDYKQIHILGVQNDVNTVKSHEWNFNHLEDALFGLNDPLEISATLPYVFGLIENSVLIFVVAVVTDVMREPGMQYNGEMLSSSDVKMEWSKVMSRAYFLNLLRRSTRSNSLSQLTKQQQHLVLQFGNSCNFYKFYPMQCDVVKHLRINEEYGDAVKYFDKISWQTKYQILHSVESQFNQRVYVSKMEKWRLLSFVSTPDNSQIQGKVKYNEEDQTFDYSGRCGYIDTMASAGMSFINEVYPEETPLQSAKLLFVGLGAGTLPNIFCRSFPETSIDVVEIDPMVAEAAVNYFGFPKDRTNIFVQDVRDFVQDSSSSSKKYHSIFFDCYIVNDQGLPADMRTESFLQRLSSVLEPNGIIIANVYWSNKTGLKKVNALFKKVFPAVSDLAVQECSDNHIIVARKCASATEQSVLASASQITSNVTLDFDIRSVLDYGLKEGKFLL